MQLTSYSLRPAAGIVIDLTFDIFKMPDFGVPSLDASYLLSIGIFIVTVFLAYLRQAFVMCLGLPIFNMADSKPGRIERRVMRVFSLSRCVRKPSSLSQKSTPRPYQLVNKLFRRNFRLSKFSFN